MAFFGPPDAPLGVGAPASCSFVGAESNLAIGLARLGHRVRFLSALGDDVFGREILKQLRGESVDVARVELRDGAPTGVLFQSRRGWAEPEVLYYRRDSAFARLEKTAFDASALEGAKVLLLGGIAPALGEGPHALSRDLMKWAREADIPIWFDVNYRRKLWDATTARAALLPFVRNCDVVLAGIEEAQLMTDCGETRPEMLAAKLRELGPQSAIVKCGTGGSLWQDEGGEWRGESVPLSRVVSPIGAGDAFGAGLLSGALDELAPPHCLQRAHALAAMACLSSGDWEGLPSRADLEQFQRGQLETR